MSSRDKDTKLLQDMLKVFFKKGSSAPLPPRNELVVTAELERELAAETPPPRRLRALKDLADRALTVRMPEGAVTKLWTCIRDLLDDPNVESRHAALSFLCSVAEGQGDELLIMRTIFFRYLKETHPNHPPEDTQLRFKLLYTLTNSGKNIKCFEEQIGAFLLEWLPQIQSPQFTVEFLQLIINVVKFNATYLDEDIVQGIVNEASRVCSYVAAEEVVVAALSLLEAVLSYSLLPREALPALVTALCRAANLEPHCHAAWKLMRSMLGADIGHATLHTLTLLLRAGAGAGAGAEAGVLRGAVFFVGAALWGPRRVLALALSPLAVLPALLKVLDAEQAVVTYEVVLSLQSLLSRAAAELREPAWDLLLRILRRLLDLDKKLEPANELIHSGVHALLTSVEQLQESGQYCGDDERLLELLDYCGHELPEPMAARVVSALAARLSLGAGGPGGGGAGVRALAERYVRLEPRQPLRLHALHALLRLLRRDSELYGWEVVERVGVPLLAGAAADADGALRAAAARALADLALAADTGGDLVELLEKILNRPFEVGAGEAAVGPDAALAAGGLLRLLQRPAAAPAAARAYAALLDHLEAHYRRPAVFLHHPDIRLKILEMVFALRVNSFNCVGFCYDASGAVVSGVAAARLRPLCCPLLLSEPPQRPLPGSALVDVGRGLRALGAALSREAEWRVLGAVLRALPPLLGARSAAAVAAGRARSLDALAAALAALAARPPDGRVPLSELHQATLPALAALAPHHAALEPATQQRTVRCLLKYGMVLRSPQPYINALTMFTLEMRDTMVKMLPEVLLDLSKISDTKAIASPMLEFLSTLTRLPAVFSSFVEDQYMSVFAIVLPYTNPSRYNHYVVSLAHHVIAAWFLKCRLSYRRNFVRFIIHGLHNYIIMPFEEQLQYKSNHFQQANVNEDSSNRQRSSSLGSKAVSRAPMGARGAAGGGPAGGAPAAGGSSSASAAFHVELTEACVDLLARYTTTAVSVKPHRSELAEFLFSGGQSMTWLVGHKLVTVTTSGCLQNCIKQGLCDRCAVLCRQHADSFGDADPGSLQVPTTDNSGSDTPEIKRYSARSLQHSRSSDTSASSDVPPPSRQNSSENSKSSDAADGLQFSQKFDRIPKEPESEESWSRWGGGGGGGGGGGCPCWCARWAEVTVRAAAGDTSFVLRVQNDLAAAAHDQLLELAALLAAPAPAPASASASAPAPHCAPAPLYEDEGHPSGSHPAASHLAKSSSDSVVSGERKSPHAASHCIDPPPHRRSTQPINIPGSPQRQPARSAADDDDLLLLLPEGKCRHPVRRSNSSPEMSSSWKPERHTPDDLPLPPDTSVSSVAAVAASVAASVTAAASLHLSKKAAKKSDMRVSCEAIPEEMCGTSPHLPPPAHQPQPHHHLMTYNSDPGKVDDEQTSELASSHHQLQKTASDSTVTSSAQKPAAPADTADTTDAADTTAADPDDLPPLSRSKRSHTISVMSPTRRHRDSVASRSSAGAGGGGGAGAGGGGLTPAFVFLQLYHNMSTYPVAPPVPGEAPTILNPLSERPLRVAGVQHERTIKNLDLVPPLDTYKVGVLYVGPGQHDNEVAILRNEYGSLRYAEFLSGLGALVPLDSPPPPDLFLNLEPGGRDGAYTYVWHDDIMQVLFHVATAMPSRPTDPTCNEKRKYIGNDFVSIVYNDSEQDFNIHTIKGQFNFCIVVVEPYEHGLNRVLLKTKDEMLRSKFLAHVDGHVVSDGNVAALARQLALHAALASQIWQSLKVGGAPYASNSLERLRLIKRLRRRLEGERLAAAARPAPYQPPATDLALRVAGVDFNGYT